MLRPILLALLLSAAFANPVWAQAGGLNLGGLSVDPEAAVEISADGLTVNQDTGRAVFEGNVKIAQGAMRLGADRVVVGYSDDGDIDQMIATGNVLFVTDTEEAEAQSAVYSLTGQSVVLTGDVLLTQGKSALLADTMRVDLTTGNAVMEGRVRTVLQPNKN